MKTQYAKIGKAYAKAQGERIARKYMYEPSFFATLGNLEGKDILDLGCGLNPLSLPEEFMKNIKYYAGDINQDDLEIVNEYFRKNKFEGDVFFYDLKLQKLGVFGTSNKLAYCKNANDHLPKTDVCFLFKVLDLIDNKGHKNAEKVLKQIPAKFVIVSFSKITLSGKKLNASRNWLKLLIERLRWKYYLFETENEMFFVINKS